MRSSAKVKRCSGRLRLHEKSLNLDRKNFVDVNNKMLTFYYPPPPLNQVHPFLQGISFNNTAGERLSFNDKWELGVGFDIMNLVTFPNQSFSRVKIGIMDFNAPEGQEFVVHENMIVWQISFNQVCIPGSSQEILHSLGNRSSNSPLFQTSAVISPIFQLPFWWMEWNGAIQMDEIFIFLKYVYNF